MEEKKLTPEQALQNIGIALSNKGLKLCQVEHLTLISSYNILKELIEIKTKEK